MQSFLNCYLRETSHFTEIEKPEALRDLSAQKFISCLLENQGIELILPVSYWSLTGRHIFQFPLIYRIGNGAFYPLDYLTLTTLIVKELLIDQNRYDAEDELIMRIILSCQNMKSYIEERYKDKKRLSDETFDYIEAEQSLLLGHLLHPTPKSKQGLSIEEDRLYSPELNGEFQLHYFSVHPSIILEDSSLSLSASELMREELQADESVNQEWLNQFEKWVLIPVHPLQVKVLLKNKHVVHYIQKGKLDYLGPVGKMYTATSSFRTLYSHQSKYMLKFSVPVKITNSLRVNQQKELDRGVEVSRLLKTTLGKELKRNHPKFDIIRDPAYLNVAIPDLEPGFAVVIRENPFYENSENTSLVAALCQDHAYGGNARLHSIITSIARREGRAIEKVSLEWFDRYLSLSLDPMLWLYRNYGIALEAHQQNSVIKLSEGYPLSFYYRDNQGYYFSESMADKLSNLLPDLNEKSDTICADEVANERFRYYFFFNHLFGLINAFGVNGLIKEQHLIDLLRERLLRYEAKHPSSLVKSLLEEPVLPCKANLLTRFYDMDELVGSLETQSVYTMVNNPIAQEVAVENGS
ncbi:IucA/IucC family protein [Bacillus sp. N1-1]|uniref:IucA/IucC family protein n=1 Tax=Bacillus sp. N1-1 TaxID=2682541 RepID=UPI001F0E8466|nr:IucA/IucC family protein [Bacillus sp. N1-1]